VRTSDDQALGVLGWTMAICSPIAACTVAALRATLLDDLAFWLTVLWMIGCMFVGVALLTIRR